MSKKGANEVVGVEPSDTLVKISRARYPKMEILHTTWQKAVLGKKFDVVTSIMAFEHIPDLISAFSKVKDHLSLNGHFFFIAGAKKYQETDHSGYNVQVHKIDDATTVVRKERDNGVMYDILRTPQKYLESAESAGLMLVEKIDIKFTREYLSKLPKYHAFADSIIAHLYIDITSRNATQSR